MARRQAPPKPEELIAKLEEKFESFKTEITESLGEKSSEIEKINEKEVQIKEQFDANNSEQTVAVENAKSQIETLLDSKMEDMKNEFLRNLQNMSDKIANASSSTSGTEGQIQELVERVENIQEKMYDFEVNKRNNLLFYGMKGGQKESQGDLLNKIGTILQTSLHLKRDICISSASRMFSGPEVGGCRPVVVTFEEFKDREEVLRKGGLLKGSNIHVTEDMSRRVRESRQELRKFLREVKKTNPEARCNLQYDKLYVEHRCYTYNAAEGRVVEHTDVSLGGDRPGSVMDRSSPFMSPTKNRRSPGLSRAQSCHFEPMEQDKEMLAERDERIKELKEAVGEKDAEMEKLKETVKMLQEKLGSTENLETKQESIEEPEEVLEQVLEEVHKGLLEDVPEDEN